MTWVAAVDQAPPELTWVDWVGVVGFALTLIGLGLTFRQARGAKSAAEAAQAGVERTQRHLRANQLLVLVPQLRWISSELDAAIELDDAAAVRRQLDSWRWQAGHVHGVLLAGKDVDGKLLRTLQTSTGLATTANSALLQGKRPVLDACGKARETISLVCNQLTLWIGENSSLVPDGDGNKS